MTLEEELDLRLKVLESRNAPKVEVKKDPEFVEYTAQELRDGKFDPKLFSSGRARMKVD